MLRGLYLGESFTDSVPAATFRQLRCARRLTPFFDMRLPSWVKTLPQVMKVHQLGEAQFNLLLFHGLRRDASRHVTGLVRLGFGSQAPTGKF
jgi:hypothetical protein